MSEETTATVDLEAHRRRTIHLSSLVADASRELRRAQRDQDDAYDEYRYRQDERANASNVLAEATKRLVEHCGSDEVEEAGEETELEVPSFVSEAPAEERTLRIVVSGHPVEVVAMPDQALDAVIERALEEAGILEPFRLSTVWTLRRVDGSPLPDEPIGKIGLDTDQPLFLDPDSGP